MLILDFNIILIFYFILDILEFLVIFFFFEYVLFVEKYKLIDDLLILD